MAALSHVSLVRGLGSSCSQPLLANRPSQIVGSGRKVISSPPRSGRQPELASGILIGKLPVGTSPVRLACPARCRHEPSLLQCFSKSSPPDRRFQYSSDDFVRGQLGWPAQNGDNLVRRAAVVERRDQRLLDVAVPSNAHASPHDSR